MVKVFEIIKFFDLVFLSVWGLTVIEIIPLLSLGFLTELNIDEAIKTAMALVGLIWFLVTIPHKYKMFSLERKIKKEELEALTRENDIKSEKIKVKTKKNKNV